MRYEWHSANPNPDRVTRRRMLAAATVLGGVAIAGAVSRRGSSTPTVLADATPGALDRDLRVSTSGWKTDFSKHSVNLSEIRSGGVPPDGIPPIDDPLYVSIGEAATWLAAEEPVVAMERNGQARAYPLQILIWHEIVNDVLGDEPTLATFCPLCNTAVAFDRRLTPGGTVYDFGTTGNLRFSDLVMWDRQTESWWQQITGEAIVGELTGSLLTPYPAQIIGWSAFAEAYPDGDVLSRETGFSRPYGRNPYVGYDDVKTSPFLYDGPRDDRLRPMERVVGVTIDGAAAAYLLAEPVGAAAVNDEVGGREIVMLHVPGARSALDQSEIAESRDVGQVGVFERRIEDQPLTFAAEDRERFTDAETGTTWSVTGQGVAGALAGRQLTPLPHVVVFWFAWAAAYPETRLWLPE